MSTPNPTTTDWVPVWDLNGLDFAYSGAYQAGVTYNDGAIVIGSDGIAYVCVVDGTTSAPVPWPGMAGLVGPPGPQGAQGPAGIQGPPGTSIPAVQNGKWLNGIGGAAVWSSILEPDVRSLVVADTGWQIVTVFQNGWQNYGGGFPVARYRRLATGQIVMSGLVTNSDFTGKANTTAFNVPAIYRPDSYRHMGSNAVDNWGTVRVNPGGDVILNFGTAGWVTLDNVSYFP